MKPAIQKALREQTGPDGPPKRESVKTKPGKAAPAPKKTAAPQGKE